MLIGISGNKRSGKDTVAKIISTYYDTQTIALADEIKSILISAAKGAGIEITLDQLNGINYDRESPLNINSDNFNEILLRGFYMASHQVNINKWSVMKNVCDVIIATNKPENYTIRRLMQIFGTDICVDNISTNIWVDFVDQAYQKTNNKYFVITDIRQKHEFDYIKKNSGIVIHINRDTNISTDNHITEINLGKDYGDIIINNNQGLIELEAKVKQIIGDLE